MARRHSVVGRRTRLHGGVGRDDHGAATPRWYGGCIAAMLALLPSLLTVAVLLLGIVEERAAAADRRRLGRVRPAEPVTLVQTPPSARVA
jgi:hypothetical protein